MELENIQDNIQDNDDDNQDLLDGIGALEKIIESEVKVLDQQQQAQAKEMEKKKSETLAEVPERYRPADSVKCKNCKFSVWYGNEHMLKCYCKQIFNVVYEHDHKDEAIIYCDGPHLEE